jgi:hypothetical protein
MNETVKKQILTLYTEYDRVYGPYLRKSDGRRILSLSKIGTKGSTAKQYGRFLLEIKLNRRLSKNETVDHIDGDFTNDNSDNLQLLTRVENSAKSAIRAKDIIGNCKWCKGEFTLSRNQRKCRYSGPFCSRSCSGKYGKMVQESGTTWQRTEHVVEYHSIEDK